MYFYVYPLTLECGINMPACLLISKLFSKQHAFILHSVFIHSNIFDQKYQKFMFFRLQYAHFWALILVSIKFSRRHVYYFHKLFQQTCLFRQARLSCTLFCNFLQKWKNWKTHIFIHFVVSSKVVEVQRFTIPHFKAFDLLFWPLAWVITLGSIIF